MNRHYRLNPAHPASNDKGGVSIAKNILLPGVIVSSDKLEQYTKPGPNGEPPLLIYADHVHAPQHMAVDQHSTRPNPMMQYDDDGEEIPTMGPPVQAPAPIQIQASEIEVRSALRAIDQELTEAPPEFKGDESVTKTESVAPALPPAQPEVSSKKRK